MYIHVYQFSKQCPMIYTIKGLSGINEACKYWPTIADCNNPLAKEFCKIKLDTVQVFENKIINGSMFNYDDVNVFQVLEHTKPDVLVIDNDQSVL